MMIARIISITCIVTVITVTVITVIIAVILIITIIVVALSAPPPMAPFHYCDACFPIFHLVGCLYPYPREAQPPTEHAADSQRTVLLR